jgi:hypothetical protein
LANLVVGLVFGWGFGAGTGVRYSGFRGTYYNIAGTYAGVVTGALVLWTGTNACPGGGCNNGPWSIQKIFSDKDE